MYFGVHSLQNWILGQPAMHIIVSTSARIIPVSAHFVPSLAAARMFLI